MAEIAASRCLQVSPISSTNTPMPSITAGCGGSWTEATRSAQSQALRARHVAEHHGEDLAVAPNRAPTPGLCRTCWPQGVTAVRRRMSSTNSARIWSQPRRRPDRLAEQEYRPFRARSRPRCARGAVRIRPHHQAVPVVVDPRRRTARKAYALRPRRDDRHRRLEPHRAGRLSSMRISA